MSDDKNWICALRCTWPPGQQDSYKNQKKTHRIFYWKRKMHKNFTFFAQWNTAATWIRWWTFNDCRRYDFNDSTLEWIFLQRFFFLLFVFSFDFCEKRCPTHACKTTCSVIFGVWKTFDGCVCVLNRIHDQIALSFSIFRFVCLNLYTSAIDCHRHIYRIQKCVHLCIFVYFQIKFLRRFCCFLFVLVRRPITIWWVRM